MYKFLLIYFATIKLRGKRIVFPRNITAFHNKVAQNIYRNIQHLTR